MKALGVPAALLVGLTLAALFVGVSVEDVHGDPQLKYVFAVLLVLSAGAYAWAVRIVVREPGNAWLVLGVALLLRVAVLLAPPFLSSDMYRYVWDGMVQNSGISPYAYVPIDPALEALQDAAIYPNINRVEYAHTIYPPAAQMLFAAVAWLSPTILAMKAAMLGFEALAMLCALRLLQDARLPASRLAIYAWNPLAIWEFSGNGHVDAAATGCIALALLLRARRRDGLAGLALTAAILVKFLPAIVAPALWRRGGWWRLMASCSATVAALYAAYAVAGGAGWKVFGFLGQYSEEEGLADGSGLWLLAGLGTFMHLPSWLAPAYLAVGAAGLAALGLWMITRPRPQPGSPADIVLMCSQTALLGMLLILVITPHYPWYYPWLALPAVIAPTAAAIWLAAAPIMMYGSPFEDYFIWPSLIFIPALVLLWRDLRHSQPVAIPILQGTL